MLNLSVTWTVKLDQNHCTMFVKIATIALIVFIAGSKGKRDSILSRAVPSNGLYTIPKKSESGGEGWTEIPNPEAQDNMVVLGKGDENVTSGGGKVWDGFVAKWAGDPADGFHQLPQNLREAEHEGWARIPGAKAPHGGTAVGYFSDPRFILFFDKYSKKVFGAQIGFLVKDIENSGVPINYDDNPAITRQTMNGQEWFTGTVLFHKDRQGNTRRIWLRVNGEFKEYPTKSDQLISHTPYLKKRCVKWMGSHAYQINSTTDCSNIFPWSFLEVDNEIIGVVLQAVGNSTVGTERTWFETIPLSQLGFTIPDAPDCIAEGVAEHGLISLHVWFKKNPLSITCSDQCTAKYDTNADGEQSEDHSGKRYRRSEGSGNVCPAQRTSV